MVVMEIAHLNASVKAFSAQDLLEEMLFQMCVTS